MSARFWFDKPPYAGYRMLAFSRRGSEYLMICAIAELDPFQSQLRWLP